jgi:cytidylate kinase
MIIAIDGPAASGKGTLGKRLAAHYGLRHLDTGLLYRAVAQAVLDSGHSLDDVARAVAAAQALDPTQFDEVALKSHAAGEAASVVSAIPQVRAALFQLQQDFAAVPPGAVLDGRDIGTVICPHADVKIFVTASAEVRAKRRAIEMRLGQIADETAILADIRRRDHRDTQRAMAPLRPAADAHILDTSDLDIDAVVRQAIAIVDSALEPPDAPLPPPSPATRFTYANGRFDIAPSNAWRDREAQARAYHSRARTLASGLAERLSRTDAVPDLAGSVEALIDVLGESIAEVQPDLLRLASRSIAARARAYAHPAAQWEISADSVGAFFELADVLVDLQTFVRTDLEAHEQAVRELDLTPEKAADAKIALDLVTDAILSAPEVISETAQIAFEAAAEVSQTAADRDVKVAVEGDRTLLTTNLTGGSARVGARQGGSDC